MGKPASSHVLIFGIETMKCLCVAAVFAFGILLVLSFFVNCVVLYLVGGILFLMPLLEPLVMKWKPKKRILPAGKAVFISGCDTGFGHMFARRLDDMGFKVFAGCLFPDGEGAKELRQSESSRLHTVALDVTNDGSVGEAAKYVERNLNGDELWAIINNAGVISWGEVFMINMETIQRVLEVNTVGVVRVTKAFLPMLKESKGRILTIASQSVNYCFPWVVPYIMSKSATVQFCHGLRLEMHKYGVQVVVIQPSTFRTSLMDDINQAFMKNWENSPKNVKDMYGENYAKKVAKKIDGFVKMSSGRPSEVLSTVEDAITVEHPKYTYKVGDHLSWSMIWILQRMPRPIADMLICNAMDS